MKPIIGIILGDPTGIGPEVVAKVISKNNLLPYCKPVKMSYTKNRGYITSKLGKFRSIFRLKTY